MYVLRGAKVRTQFPTVLIFRLLNKLGNFAHYLHPLLCISLLKQITAVIPIKLKAIVSLLTNQNYD